MSAVEDVGKGLLDVATGGLLSQRDAAKEQKKARQIEQKRARLTQRREAVESIRMAQIQRAQVAAAGEVSGVGQASGLLGGLGSIQSQAGSNIGFLNTQLQMRQQAERRLQSAANYQFAGSAISSLASTFGQYSLANQPSPQTTGGNG